MTNQFEIIKDTIMTNQFEIIKTLGKIRDEVTLAIHEKFAGWERITPNILEDTKAIIYRILCAKIGECLLDEFDINSDKDILNIRLMCAGYQLPFSVRTCFVHLPSFGLEKQDIEPVTKTRTIEFPKIVLCDYEGVIEMEKRLIKDTFFPTKSVDITVAITNDNKDDILKDDFVKSYERAMKIID